MADSSEERQVKLNEELGQAEGIGSTIVGNLSVDEQDAVKGKAS